MGTVQIDGSTPKITVGNATAEDATILFDGNAQDFHIGLDDTADDLVIGVGSTLGTTTAIAIDENANTTFSGTVTIGSTGITNNGITTASQWRLSTGFTGDAAPIASNLEEVDSDGQGVLGSSMTESSGVFTFPSTGIWLIQMTVQFYLAADSRANQIIIETTTDGSSFGQAALTNQGITQSESGTTYVTGGSSFIFDVTSTSTHKVRFSTNVNDDNAQTEGDTNNNNTHFTFIRLGDT
jgi:hypothetical protein